tara:strand:- start:309 stop:566 length:258 start_codon:yes stop_codon:yes gene_type:complete
MHPAQNTSTFNRIFFIMINAFTSSAIESMSTTADGQVLVTFAGGRQYTYSVADVEQFCTAFNAATSKGRFVNEQIKSETLQKVAV